MKSWAAPKIWRSPESKFNDDEPLYSVKVYTPDVLQSIRNQGFDAIWMRGKLWGLIRSEIFPELNDSKSSERIANLRKVIHDAQEIGIRLFIYFNEPLGLPDNHEFWKHHPELRGQSYQNVSAFCTSTQKFKEFFNESVKNLFDNLAGLGGVILITASEYHTHCWSHAVRRKIGDKYLDSCPEEMQCPRCKEREPAEIVSELIGVWTDNAVKQSYPPEIWVWNWSWSIWYPDPQRKVIERLPTGIKLMCDFERGGVRKQEIGDVFIDEYSLGYVGPSERFLGTKRVADERNIAVCGKLQIGTTHELATVPNLPLVPNLFEKFKKIEELNLKGIMCSWNFGNTCSINTAALKLFAENEELRDDKECFLRTLTESYFGNVDINKIIKAWNLFCASFAQYPFSIPMLYAGPMNYSVAYPLLPEYYDRAMGPSWIWHEPFGDRLDDCFGPFTLDEICQCWALMDCYWTEGLDEYQYALKQSVDENQIRELKCAEMISCHISATKNIFDFHRWRIETMHKLNIQGPCKLQVDESAKRIIRKQIEICEKALKLVKDNPQFGYHQEPHAYFYTAELIKDNIERMKLA